MFYSGSQKRKKGVFYLFGGKHLVCVGGKLTENEKKLKLGWTSVLTPTGSMHPISGTRRQRHSIYLL